MDQNCNRQIPFFCGLLDTLFTSVQKQHERVSAAINEAFGRSHLVVSFSINYSVGVLRCSIDGLTYDLVLGSLVVMPCDSSSGGPSGTFEKGVCS